MSKKQKQAKDPVLENMPAIRKAMMDPTLIMKMRLTARIKRPVPAVDELLIRRFSRRMFPKLQPLARGVKDAEALEANLKQTYALLTMKERAKIRKSMMKYMNPSNDD